MKHCWIGPKVKPRNSGLYIFSKETDFKANDKVVFRISADTRYRFYINGKYVCEGPCQSGGDVKYYEEIDASKYIKDGKNLLEVKVWHIVNKFWDFSFTGALRNGCPALWVEWKVCRNGEKILFGTDDTWTLKEETSYKFTKHINFIHLSETDGIKTYKPLRLTVLRETERFLHYTAYGYKETYPLELSPLPQMHECDGTEFKVVKQGKNWVELDAGKNITARLKFDFVARKKTKIKIYYSESYYKRNMDGVLHKEKRDDSTGELYKDVFDTVIMDEGEKRFEPLWWKSFRFIRIESDSEIDIDARFSEYFYPLSIDGGFSSLNAEYNRIFDVSIQTLKNCMHEVFIDCPFFEQQQYCMDTALESLFAMTLSSDYRLTKKAIADIACSQGEDGFLAAHWPSQGPKQIIPTFSIFWILLLNNYLKYSGDIDTVKRFFGTALKILEGFEGLINQNGVVGKSKYWEFLDWVPEWSIRGYPNTAKGNAMAVYSMMFSFGLSLTAELADALGREQLKIYYLHRQSELNRQIVATYYDTERELFKDTELGEYSVHTAIWSVLCGIEQGDNAKSIIKRAIDEKLPRPSFSMNFFYFRALEKAGLYQEYFEEFMNDWKEMLNLNCTTWCENKKNPRSDCHGWSATPIYELISCVAGIKPVGYRADTILIDPIKISGLEEYSAKLPVKGGVVEVYVKDGKLSATAPDGISMILKVDGKEQIYKNCLRTKI